MLISDRALFAVGVAVLAIAGCAQPGVIEVAPGKAIAGTGGAQAGISGPGSGGATGASGGGVAGNTVATGGAGAAGTTIGSGGKGGGGSTAGSGGMGAGGSAAGTGGMGGAGGAASAGAGGAGDSGAGGAAALPACPSGWTCEDPMKQLTDLGAEGTVTDPSGAQIKYSCGNGGAVTCDMADPKGSCPELPNAFCAHVMVGGLLAADLYSCAQFCTP